MELFDKKFVHFLWDDELEGKTGIVSNDIKCLRDYVNNKSFDLELIEQSNDESQPFKTVDGIKFRFAYYDPNYEVKKAFNEGKTIQLQISESYWKCISSYPDLLFACNTHGILRVKPEEKWIAYLARYRNSTYRLVFCAEDRWQYVQDRLGAKMKLFVGTYAEAKEWCETRKKFVEVIKAWEDDKTIQFFNSGVNDWVDVIRPLWEAEVKYRVSPKEKEYRPYTSSAEMIADFITRFKVNCPSYAEPLIWVKHKKNVDHHYLITCFFHEAGVRMLGSLYTFDDLLGDYTYLDGSPCGMKVEKC